MTSSAGWLRGRTFDSILVFGVAAVALLSGWVVVLDPSLFRWVLAVDLLLLGYHHVISTYTRLCFDRQSFRENRFLLFGLPLLILASVVASIQLIGLWTIPTVYLYWQWFHYTRQSYGIAQAYRRKSNGLVTDNQYLNQAIIYLVPLWGILYRSYQAPEKFLWFELRVVPVPEIMVYVAGAAAAIAVGWWAVARILAWQRNQLSIAHTAFVLSQLAVFYVGYYGIEDITYGWLVINVWHNAQYVLFVWLFNTNRFKGGVVQDARFLSYLSQANKWWLYFLTCILLSTGVYVALIGFTSALDGSVLGIGLIVFMTINFHHYVVDAVIWKLRKKPLQKTLGLAG